MPHWPNGEPADPLPAGQEYICAPDGAIVGVRTTHEVVDWDDLMHRFGSVLSPAQMAARRCFLATKSSS